MDYVAFQRITIPRFMARKVYLCSKGAISLRQQRTYSFARSLFTYASFPAIAHLVFPSERPQPYYH